MTSKAHLPPVPPALADVALIDGPVAASAGGISLSHWHDLVRRKEAPQPVVRESRCTRWLLRDVRAWLVLRAAQAASNSRAGESLKARATKASAAAKAKRVPSTATGTQ